MKHVRWIVATLGLVTVVLIAAGPAGRDAQAQAPGDGSLTAEQLRAGGYVIFFRHVTADVGQDQQAVDLNDCTTQRNLALAGLGDARTIGRAFRELALPVDRVLTSEYCRAVETALVAFERAEREPALSFCCADGGPLSADERERGTRALIATPPPAGSNTVLVGHGAGLFGDLGMGEAAIYLPDGQGNAQRVARIRPDGWFAAVYPAP